MPQLSAERTAGFQPASLTPGARDARRGRAGGARRALPAIAVAVSRSDAVQSCEARSAKQDGGGGSSREPVYDGQIAASREKGREYRKITAVKLRFPG